MALHFGVFHKKKKTEKLDITKINCWKNLTFLVCVWGGGVEEDKK